MSEQPERLGPAGSARAVNSHEGADLDAAVTELRELPAGRPGRGALAAELVLRVVRAPAGSPPHGLRHLDELLRIADSDPPPGPQWPGARGAARALGMLYAASQGTLTDVDRALAELDELQAATDDNPGLRGVIESARIGLTLVRAVSNGDRTALHRTADELGKLGPLVAGNPTAERLMESLQRATEAIAPDAATEPGGVWLAMEQLQESTNALPPDHYLRTVMSDTAVRLEPFRGLLESGSEAASMPTGDQLAALAALMDRPGATDTEQMLNHLAAGGAAIAGGPQSDAHVLDQGIEHFRQAMRLATDDAQRAFAAQSLALGLFRRSEAIGTTAGLTEATELLERACSLLGGPGNPQWTLAHGLLADVRQRLGQNLLSRQSGLAAQRSFVWQALLQPDPAQAERAIHEAAHDAVYLARRCLHDNNAGDAIRALDTGRGLILFAEIEGHRIAAHLQRAGQPALGRRWQAAGPDGPDDELRREVLKTLSSEQDSASRLLDPPTLPDIQAALATVDADALVYLMPGDPPLTGAVIIAPVTGAPSYISLPNLVAGDDEVERYLDALDSRTRDLVLKHNRPSRADEVRASLGALCDWAWRVAIGPLLEQYVARRPRPASGRVPRLILIPMGDLARIPWQAARRSDGRYAIELAAFSQAASARMLCESASRRPVPITSVGLVVGDPDTGRPERSLVSARGEAYEIRQRFYRGARYLGRRSDGTPSPSGVGTADQVRQWLTDPDPAAGTLLHLACHGSFRVDRDNAKSFLSLAHDEELGAEELVSLMTEAAPREIALAVLAACNTGRAIHGYDEAYSLGTAFLAGGARAVLSTQWSIPDLETSSLMFMFHRYLREGGRPAWDALRQAQLWMLDPDREAPDDLPLELRPGATAVGVAAWAAFVHWGQ